MDKENVMETLSLWFVVFFCLLPVFCIVFVFQLPGRLAEKRRLKKLGKIRPDLDKKEFVDQLINTINQGLTEGKCDEIPLEHSGREPRRL